MMAEQARPSIREEKSPSNIAIGVLSELASQEEVAKSKSSGKRESKNASTMVFEKNK